MKLFGVKVEIREREFEPYIFLCREEVKLELIKCFEEQVIKSK